MPQRLYDASRHKTIAHCWVLCRDDPPILCEECDKDMKRMVYRIQGKDMCDDCVWILANVHEAKHDKTQCDKGVKKRPAMAMDSGNGNDDISPAMAMAKKPAQKKKPAMAKD